MNLVENLLSRHLVNAMGWTVLHSLWQGTIIALILALVFFALQRKTARLRYRIAFGALLLLFVSSLTTFFLLYDPQGSGQQPTRLVLLGDVRMVVEKSNYFQQMMTRFGNYFDAHLPVIVTVWLVGVFFFLIRLLGGMAYVRRMRVYGSIPAPDPWQQRVSRLAETLQLNKVIGLAESSLTKAPLMIGFFKPLILLPVGTINHLSADEVEAILAHELAHIARQDYIFNIMQSLIEIIYYYHPAAWWISAVIRTEREHCCDDTAIRLCSNPLTYAKALLHVQELQHYRTPVLAMAFSGHKNQLLYRIQRILNQSHNKSRTMEKFIATCALLCLLAALTYGSNSHRETPAPPADMKTVIIASVPDTVPGADKKEAAKKSKEVELIMEDGEIQSLKIDCETIPEQDYPKYKSLTDDLMEEAVPPVPPAPPGAPGAPAPPAPPVPGRPAMPPPPPPAPRGHNPFGSTAPRPLAFQGDKISYHQTDDGRTVIIIDSDGDQSASEIRVEDGVVYFNGDALQGTPAPEDMSFQFRNGYSPEALRELQSLSPVTNFEFIYDMEGLAPLANPELYRGDLKDRLRELEQMRKDQKRAYKESKKAYLRSRDMNPAPASAAPAMREEAARMRDEAILMSEGRLLDQEIVLNEAARREVEAALRNQEIALGNFNEDARREVEAALRHQEIALADIRASSPEVDIDIADLIAFPDRPDRPADFDQVLEENLAIDGFMKNGDNYSFYLDSKGLTINGQKQSAEMFEKYKSIYEESNGTELCDDCSIEISKMGSKSSKSTKSNRRI